MPADCSPTGSEKIHEFFVTTVAGLEKVVLESLRGTLPGADQFRAESDRRHGRVFFRYQRSPLALLGIRSTLSTMGLVSNVRKITAGRPGLERLCEAFRRADLAGARRLAKACDPRTDVDRFQLVCTVAGSHRFSRREVSERVRKILSEEHGLQPASGGTALRLRVQVTGHRGLFAVQVGSRRDTGDPRRGLSEALVSTLAGLVELDGSDTVVCINCQEVSLNEQPVQSVIQCRESVSTIPESTCALWTIVNSPLHLPLIPHSVSCIFDGSDASTIQDRLIAFAETLALGGIVMIVFAKIQAVVGALQTMELPLEILAVLPIYIKGRSFACCVLERRQDPLSEWKPQLARGPQRLHTISAID